jgi:outer membrane lipoprotein-sorting protein
LQIKEIRTSIKRIEDINKSLRRAKKQKKHETEENMKKVFSFCLLSVFLFGVTASPGVGQKAMDVLGKMIDAQGGRKVLGSIKDTTMTGTLEIAMAGMSGSLTMSLKEPNKMRMDMEMMGMVFTQAYDGEIAWGTNPQTGVNEELPAEQGEELMRQASGNDIFLNPDKHGVTFTLKDSENIEGKDYYVMVQTFPDGYQMTMYIDSKTYLTYKTVTTVNQMGVESEAESFPSDWREVEGTMVPFVLRILYDGEEAVTMTFTEVKYNSGIEDSFFKMD